MGEAVAVTVIGVTSAPGVRVAGTVPVIGGAGSSVGVGVPACCVIGSTTVAVGVAVGSSAGVAVEVAVVFTEFVIEAAGVSVALNVAVTVVAGAASGTTTSSTNEKPR